jgi:hypothetical protein
MMLICLLKFLYTRLLHVKLVVMMMRMQHVRDWSFMTHYTMGSDLVEVEFNRLHFMVGLEI